MKNKTAPHNACGFTRFFRFAGLLPIGASSAKRNGGPQCLQQAVLGGFGGVLYKNHEPPGVSARRRRKFLEDLGGVVHKNHVTEVHSGTCFRRKTPPKSSKISACGGRLGTEKSHRFSLRARKSPDFRLGLRSPRGDPPRGEVSMSLGEHPPKIFAASRRKTTPNQWF